MKKLFIILVLASFFPLSAVAQYSSREESICKNTVKDAQTDSLALNSFSSSFYSSRNVLERNYDFELYNKQRKLRMWSNEVRILSYASMLAVMATGSWFAVDRGWSLWITIPTEVVICGGICYGMNIWANNLSEKADALQELSLSVMEINHNSNLCITHYSMGRNLNLGFGIGYQYNF